MKLQPEFIFKTPKKRHSIGKGSGKCTHTNTHNIILDIVSLLYVLVGCSLLINGTMLLMLIILILIIDIIKMSMIFQPCGYFSRLLSIGIVSFMIRSPIRWSWSPGSLWIGCVWSRSLWCGCLFCTGWLLQRPPNTKPSVTSARSVLLLASGKMHNGSDSTFYSRFLKHK